MYTTLKLLHGAKSPDQTWNSEFEKYFINDVDSFRDAKHHYVKFPVFFFPIFIGKISYGFLKIGKISYKYPK